MAGRGRIPRGIAAFSRNGTFRWRACAIWEVQVRRLARTGVADIYLASVMKPKEEKKKEFKDEERQKGEVRLAEEQVREYLGDYFSDELRVTYRLEAAEGKLRLTMGLPSGHSQS